MDGSGGPQVYQHNTLDPPPLVQADGGQRNSRAHRVPDQAKSVEAERVRGGEHVARVAFHPVRARWRQVALAAAAKVQCHDLEVV